MEIKRDAYLEQLKIRKDNGMIKIIIHLEISLIHLKRSW